MIILSMFIPPLIINGIFVFLPHAARRYRLAQLPQPDNSAPSVQGTLTPALYFWRRLACDNINNFTAEIMNDHYQHNGK